VLQQTLSLIAFPIAALLIGGTVAAFWPPNRRLQSYFQHFAAGVVFAALAGEVLPDLVKTHPTPAFIVVGFTIGVLVMLAIRWLVENKLTSGSQEAENPNSLILVVSIDLLIDGLLLGVGISLGEATGILLAIALTTEILFLGLSIASSMLQSGARKGKIITTVGVVALPLLVGGLLGSYVFSGIHHNGMVMVLSFAAAALLYLVTEELLVEAHEIPETAFSTSTFFIGFLLLYLLEVIY
jgi:ZIP family zinc transporter